MPSPTVTPSPFEGNIIAVDFDFDLVEDFTDPGAPLRLPTSVAAANPPRFRPRPHLPPLGRLRPQPRRRPRPNHRRRPLHPHPPRRHRPDHHTRRPTHFIPHQTHPQPPFYQQRYPLFLPWARRPPSACSPYLSLPSSVCANIASHFPVTFTPRLSLYVVGGVLEGVGREGG